jgi:serine/threonine protein kinase
MAITTDFPNIRPGEKIGPFTIEDLLSKEGNMSRLFIAKNENNRPVALKIARSDDQLFTNFIQDEVAQLSKIRHPNIVHLYPINLAKNRKVYIARGVNLAPLFGGNAPWYYAMEMINGKSMHFHRETLSKYPMEWRVELLYQISLGIHYLHNKQVAHRDLKPDNIIFRTEPNIRALQRPDPVLVDFGIASRHNETPHVFAGTLRYAAPEVVERLMNIRANYRTTMSQQANHLMADVWAFGVMAYELMTGRHPFEPYSNDEELAARILHSPPTPMHGTPQEIQRIILGDPNSPDQFGGLRWGMLSKVREDRPETDMVLQHFDIETPYQPPRY